jgi:hypothetical protein
MANLRKFRHGHETVLINVDLVRFIKSAGDAKCTFEFDNEHAKTVDHSLEEILRLLEGSRTGNAPPTS